jgi:hypothetical protein
VRAHQWGCIAILLGMLLDFWQLGVVKVDMLKYLEVAISGLRLASPADIPAGSAPLVIEKVADLLGKLTNTKVFFGSA